MVNVILCKCGCGQEVKAYRKGYRSFIYGHARKNTHIQKVNMIHCLCGCGKELNEFDKRNRLRKYIPGHTLIGKVMSNETKRKISEANSNRVRRPEEIERLRELAKQRIGKPLSEEHRLKISIGEKGRPSWNKDKVNIYSPELLLKKRMAFLGENNPKWKGGIYKSFYPVDFTKTFRKIIRKRDNYLCMICNNSSPSIRGLPVHHIDYNPNNNINLNCIRLCYSCHKKVHISKNENDWINFFKKLLNERYGYQYETICQESALRQ